jgi:predicted CoA-binding protein
MSGEACPLPTDPSDADERSAIERMLAATRIAIVGLSDDPSRPSHGVARYLLAQGKLIIPVNPNYERVLGLKCYASLAEFPEPIEVVNVFRRPEYCAAVIEAAIAGHAKGVWLQAGIRSPEARRIAKNVGIDYVEDRCIMVEHMRTSGPLSHR